MSEIQEAIEILKKSNEILAIQIKKLKSVGTKAEQVGLQGKYYDALTNCENEYHACEMAENSLQEQAEREKECKWKLVDDDTDIAQRYKTDCGHEFFFEDGTPEENGFKTCPYCGRKLVNPNE